MSEINTDERVVVAKSSINVANIILAITVLIVAIALLRYFGMI
jgi:small-conductance mechanosensitive channel